MDTNRSDVDAVKAEDEGTPARTERERVPFTVEMMELDNNPIILQPKSY